MLRKIIHGNAYLALLFCGLVIGSGSVQAQTSFNPPVSRPWATILCKFSDIPDEQRDKLWYETLMGGSYPGMDHYWRENSYNQINLEGSQVYGWYTLPEPISAYYRDWTGDGLIDGMDTTKVRNDCVAVADADVFFPNFSGINFVLNGWLGSAQGNPNFLNLDGQSQLYGMTWLVWAVDSYVLAHEMGHGLGLSHSSGAYGNEYDSLWDPMSAGGLYNPNSQYGHLPDHTISFHKDKLGWIPPGRKYMALPGTTRQIFIERLAQPVSTTDYLMAQIPFTERNDQYYTVEARRYAGYDLELPGEAVIINYLQGVIVDGTTLRGGIAQIVDSDTTNIDPNDAGAMWTAGETFTDVARGISVTVEGMTSTGYYVTISNNPLPDLILPDLVTTPTDLSIGGNNTVSVTVRNNGGEMMASSMVGIYLSTTDPAITTQDTLLGTWLLPAPLGTLGEVTNSISVAIPSTLAEGTYYLGAIADIYNELPEIDESNNVAWTTIFASDMIVPSAPTSLTAVTGVTRVDLTWTASTDNVGVASYDIERCTGNNCSNFVVVGTVTSTSFSNSGLTGGTKYRYQVRAKDVGENFGPYSRKVYATPLADTQPPATPTNLIATVAGMTQINLSWPAASDNVAVIGYDIERCSGTTCTPTALTTTTGTSYPNTGLAASTTYRYRVRAYDAAGNKGAYSPIALARTDDDTVTPGTTTGLVTTPVSGAQINLGWTAATDNVAVTGYKIERCTGSGCSNFGQIATSTTTSYSNTGLTGLTTYCYQVRAYDAGELHGAYSNPVCATTQVVDTIRPSTPTSLTATAASKSQVNLSWPVSTDNVGVTGYEIERCTGTGCTSFNLLTTVTGTSYSNTGLTGLTTYRYLVKAYDAAGNRSDPSPITTVTTPKR